MSLNSVAAAAGVREGELRDLLHGLAGAGIGARLGVPTRTVQDFIEGTAVTPLAKALGVRTSALQELRDALERRGAIGFVIGAAVERPPGETIPAEEAG